jgi:hypothetical protein
MEGVGMDDPEGEGFGGARWHDLATRGPRIEGLPDHAPESAPAGVIPVAAVLVVGSLGEKLRGHPRGEGVFELAKGTDLNLAEAGGMRTQAGHPLRAIRPAHHSTSSPRKHAPPARKPSPLTLARTFLALVRRGSLPHPASGGAAPPPNAQHSTRTTRQAISRGTSTSASPSRTPSSSASPS